jgi:hypothetical protein
VGNPANRNSRVVVVEDLSREEVDFTSERQPNDKGVQPISAPRFVKPSQVVRFASG